MKKEKQQITITADSRFFSDMYSALIRADIDLMTKIATLGVVKDDDEVDVVTMALIEERALLKSLSNELFRLVSDDADRKHINVWNVPF